ncbi:MAG: DUF4260 domain-containing protein [Candidatus Kapabacteria bacterium]|jgi:hypothetical protein|nr:DUF4260 domain-containing protein [Candidatus Kapabacteria bacterium]
MKTLLKLEETALFALSLVAFAQLPYAWWWYPALILLPDVSMLGYLINPRVGASLYNLVHHKAFAVVVWFLGLYSLNTALQLAGVILFGHSAMDRIAGYGLKYMSGFKDTHLGTI